MVGRGLGGDANFDITKERQLGLRRKVGEEVMKLKTLDNFVKTFPNLNGRDTPTQKKCP